MGFWEPLFFWIFAIGAIASSIAVIRFKNPLYSALSLVVDFFCFAGLYALLSAHFIAVTQVLVYTGAIMVLFLFIIMLLNLKDDELEQFDFRIHHVLAIGGAVGMLVLFVSAITPIANQKMVVDGRVAAKAAHATAVEANKKSLEEVKSSLDAEKDEQKKAALKARLDYMEKNPPKYLVQTKTAVPSLYVELNEDGLEQLYLNKNRAYQSGRTSPNSGKYARFDNSRPMVMPPALTGAGLKTKRGVIRPGKPATFGTIEPISLLIVNRFVVPFELTALLLLTAIIGAVIIAKRRL